MPSGIELRHQFPDVDHAPLDRLGRGDQSLAERGVGIDRLDRPLERLDVEHGVDDGADQLVLVGERIEERAFADARDPSQLAGGGADTLVDHEREDGRHDGGPTFVGRERSGAAAGGGG